VAKQSGIGSDYTCTFSGGPPVQNAWVVAFVYSDNNQAEPWITGGTYDWTSIGGTGITQAYVHRCTSTEPTSYTIKYVGDEKSDTSAVLMIELLELQALNPDYVRFNGNMQSGEILEIVTSGRGLMLSGIISGASNSASPPYYNTAPPGYTIRGTQFADKVVGAAQIVVATEPVQYGTYYPPTNWVDYQPGTVTNDNSWVLFFRAAVQP
jgi:hypothetical protein